METKRFSMGSPKAIAEFYGGDKQKILQALQSGALAVFAPPPFDQTVALAAGNYIDRTRLAQMQPPQSTVAQQVMGGAPTQIGSPPQASGLGLTPSAAPPMAPDMAPPMAPPPQAPVGMAGGGLSDLPIPDTMFDENRNGGYAGGGIIAFGAGTPGAYGKFFEETALSAIPGIRVTGRQRDAARNAQVGGVPNSFHLSDDARDFVPPKGMTMKQLAAALRGKFGSNFDVLDEGDHVHVEPGPKAGAQSVIPERNLDTAQGRAMSVEDSVSLAQRFMRPSKELLDAEDKQRARLEEMGSDEYYEAQRMDSLADFMATVGFNMGASKAPGILQMFNEAAAAALPGARADKKERKALKDKALDGLIALGARDRERANEAFKAGVDIYKGGLEAEQAEKLMAFRDEELRTRVSEGALDRDVQREALIARAKNPSEFDTKLAAYQQAYPGFSTVALLKQMRKDGLLGSSQNMGLFGAEGTGAEDASSGMSIVGSRPAA